MILFFDENIPHQIAQALRAIGRQAKHLTEELAPGTSDTEMLSFLGVKDDWLLVTQDARITKRPHERKALVDANLGAFFFTGRAEKSVEQLLILILECLPEIEHYASCTVRPFLIGISDQGKFKQLE